MRNTPEEWERKAIIIKEYLNDASFTGGRDRLWQHIRKIHPEISRREVAQFLAEDPIAQMHQPLQKRITTRPIIVKDKAKVAGIDLIDMQQLAGYNNSVRYLLTYVDLLSKWVAVRSLTNKTQVKVTAALLDILDSVPDDWRPSTIVCDRGSEFQLGMERALKQRDIKLMHSAAYNPRSNGAVERVNKSLKSAMFSLMARHETKNYMQFIPSLVENFNGTIHGTTQFRPIDLMNQETLSKETIALIHSRMKAKVKRPEGAVKVYQVGDFVRVALSSESAIRKLTFRKRIMNNYSSCVFQVYSVSTPQSAAAQPQYLLYNTETHRKSKKKYWSYQLLKIKEPTAVLASESNVNESDEVDEVVDDDAIPAVASVVPDRPRNTRVRQLSSTALRNIVNNDYY